VTVRTPATKRSRRTRAELARSAHEQLAQHGTINVEAIAAAAGVSTATFYAHFATHDDAIAAALDVSLTEVVCVVERLFHIEALIEVGLDEVLRRLVSATHDVFRSESSIMRAALARISVHRPTREVYRGHEARSLEHLERQIELGQKAGLLGDGESGKRAISLLILLQGLHNPLLTKKRIDPVIANDLHAAIHALLTPG